MQRWVVGMASRRVLGSLNDLAFQLEVGLLNFRIGRYWRIALVAKTPQFSTWCS